MRKCLLHCLRVERSKTAFKTLLCTDRTTSGVVAWPFQHSCCGMCFIFSLCLILDELEGKLYIANILMPKRLYPHSQNLRCEFYIDFDMSKLSPSSGA